MNPNRRLAVRTDRDCYWPTWLELEVNVVSDVVLCLKGRYNGKRAKVEKKGLYVVFAVLKVAT